MGSAYRYVMKLALRSDNRYSPCMASQSRVSDARIGEAVRRLRGERPQVTVATSMALLGGFSSWDKSVVGKVELAKRSLKLSEAVTLAHILGCSLEDLVKKEG